MRWLLALLISVSASAQSPLDSLYAECGVTNDPATWDSLEARCIVNQTQHLLYSEMDYFLESTQHCLTYAELNNDLFMQRSVYNRLGNSRILMEQYDSARYFYNEGIRVPIADSSGLTGLYMNIGVTYYSEDKPRLALEYYLRSLAMAQALGEKDQSFQYTNIGIVYLQLKMYDKFKVYALKTLDIAVDNGDPSAFPYVYNNLGLAYKNQNDVDSAFYYYYQAKRYAHEYETGVHLADVYTNLSNLHLDRNALDSAEYYARQVLYFREVYQLGNQGYGAVYTDLAAIYNKRGNHRRALSLLDSMRIKKTQIDFNSTWPEYLKERAATYSYLGRFQEAYQLQLQLIEHVDSVKENEKVLSIAEMEEKRAIREIELQDSIRLRERELVLQHDIDVKDKENRAKDRIILWVAIFSGFLLLLLGLVFVLLKQRRKNQLVISEQNKHLQEKNQEITDSISYAKRIQTAILPPDQFIKSHLKESFVLYKPKDIVAGDFYWLHPAGDVVLLAAADCTGHGVPGAMVSRGV